MTTSMAESLKVGEMVALSTASRCLYRIHPTSASRQKWTFHADESPFEGSTFPVEAILMVVKEKEFFGFRSVAADGRVLQAAKDKKLRVENHNFKSWEQWIISNEADGLVDLRNRQFSAVNLRVHIERVVAMPEDVAKKISLLEFTAAEKQPQPLAGAEKGSGGEVPSTSQERGGNERGGGGSEKGESAVDESQVFLSFVNFSDGGEGAEQGAGAGSRERFVELEEENKRLAAQLAEARKAAESAKFSAEVAMKIAQEFAGGRAVMDVEDDVEDECEGEGKGKVEKAADVGEDGAGIGVEGKGEGGEEEMRKRVEEMVQKRVVEVKREAKARIEVANAEVDASMALLKASGGMGAALGERAEGEAEKEQVAGEWGSLEDAEDKLEKLKRALEVLKLRRSEGTVKGNGVEKGGEEANEEEKAVDTGDASRRTIVEVVGEVEEEVEKFMASMGSYEEDVHAMLAQVVKEKKQVEEKLRLAEKRALDAEGKVEQGVVVAEKGSVVERAAVESRTGGPAMANGFLEAGAEGQKEAIKKLEEEITGYVEKVGRLEAELRVLSEEREKRIEEEREKVKISEGRVQVAEGKARDGEAKVAAAEKRAEEEALKLARAEQRVEDAERAAQASAEEVEKVKQKMEEMERIEKAREEIQKRSDAEAMKGLLEKISAAEDQLRAAERRAEELQSEIGAARGEIEDARRKEGVAEEALLGLRSLVQQLQGQREKAEVEREKAKAEREKAEGEREKAVGEREKAEEERRRERNEFEKILESKGRDVARLQQEVVALSSTVDKERKAKSSLDQEVKDLRGRVAEGERATEVQRERAERAERMQADSRKEVERAKENNGRLEQFARELRTMLALKEDELISSITRMEDMQRQLAETESRQSVSSQQLMTEMRGLLEENEALRAQVGRLNALLADADAKAAERQSSAEQSRQAAAGALQRSQDEAVELRKRAEQAEIRLAAACQQEEKQSFSAKASAKKDIALEDKTHRMNGSPLPEPIPTASQPSEFHSSINPNLNPNQISNLIPTIDEKEEERTKGAEAECAEEEGVQGADVERCKEAALAVGKKKEEREVGVGKKGKKKHSGRKGQVGLTERAVDAKTDSVHLDKDIFRGELSHEEVASGGDERVLKGVNLEEDREEGEGNAEESNGDGTGMESGEGGNGRDGSMKERAVSSSALPGWSMYQSAAAVVATCLQIASEAFIHRGGSSTESGNSSGKAAGLISSLQKEAEKLHPLQVMAAARGRRDTSAHHPHSGGEAEAASPLSPPDSPRSIQSAPLLSPRIHRDDPSRGKPNARPRGQASIGSKGELLGKGKLPAGKKAGIRGLKEALGVKVDDAELAEMEAMILNEDVSARDMASMKRAHSQVPLSVPAEVLASICVVLVLVLLGVLYSRAS